MLWGVVQCSDKSVIITIKELIFIPLEISNEGKKRLLYY